MKNIVLLIIILFNINNNLLSQKEYFLQKTDFNIKADLNPVNKTLNGEIELTYHNNSPVDLNEIYFHLHANAFGEKTSAFAKKLLKANKTDLYFSKPSEMGGYEKIDFKSGNSKLNWNYTDESKQVVKLTLSSPIKSGKSTKINITYLLKIPKNIFGFGYENKQFNMVYWYPKPAVYDLNGWNTNQLNINKFQYSNFGDYTVSLYLPKNYYTASSGILTTKTEIESIEDRILQSKSNDSLAYKILDPWDFKQVEFKADNINNFVWFSSPEFKIAKINSIKHEQGNIRLFVYYNGRRIKVNDVDSLMSNTVQVIKNFSRKLGNYPNNQISIVLSDKTFLSYSYPMLITAISKDYRREYSEFYQKLIYNINSSWFESIFSINSNDYPWMKIGIPEYYKIDYIENTFHEKHKIRKDFNTFKETSEQFGEYRNFKSASLKADEYKTQNEVISFAKYKTALSLVYLEDYLGKELFNKIMYSFVTSWKFNHPNSTNFRNHFEKFTKSDLSWFFDGLLSDPNPFNYNIKSAIQTANEYKVVIENQGKYKIPFKLGYLSEGNVPKTKKIEGFVGSNEIILEENQIDRIKIDPFDLYFKDKKLKTKVKTNKKLKNNKNLSFYKKKKRSHFIFPALGYNANDGFMLGVLYSSFNKKNMDYYISPVYGFRSKSLVGLGNINKNYILKKRIKKVKLGVNARSFNRLHKEEFQLRYLRISPYVNICFGNKTVCGLSDQLHYKFSYIKDESYNGKEVQSYNRYINKLDYAKVGGNVITPLKINIGLEHQYYNYYEPRHYLMIHTDIKTGYMYKKGRFINLRLYGATYLYNTHTNSTGTSAGTLNLIGHAVNDYGYENYFFDRSAQEGFWSRQLSKNTGGFKTAIGSSYNLGQSNKYVVSANIVFDLPIKMFIKPYFDIGIYGDLPTVSDGYSNKMLYSGGFMAQIIKDYFEIYLPIVNSQEIEDIYHEKGSFFKRVSFMMKFNLPNEKL